jgi:hypothetical protein
MMAALRNERLCAEVDGEFAVFLIGVRINQLWNVKVWLPVFSAMPRMLRELSERPELGLLHYRLHFGFPNTMVVQYWRSAAHLTAYASAREHAHLPAWRDFNKAIGTAGAVGIWHETYKAGPGTYETVYVNMPPYGLGRAGTLRPATGARNSAKDRLGG